jgi:hypothetical protein
MSQTTIEMVDGLYDIAEYMEDKELSQALEFIAKIILKPDIPPHVATLEIVRLQAIAAKMQMRATWMANVDKSDRPRKNIYFTTAAELDKIVAALKFILK